MKHDLTEAQLKQPVTVTISLSDVLRLAEAPQATLRERLAYLKTNRPNIGSKGMYGIYAGNVRAKSDEHDGILEALDEAPETMTWADAMKWAESTGGRLPTRAEQAVLYGNVPELFQKEAYWSCEQSAGGDACAWCQRFGNGNQNLSYKDDKLRARAVRR